MTRKYSILFSMIITGGLVILASCASPVSRADLDKAETRVQAGEEEAINDLYKRRTRVPEPEKDRYIEVIGEGQSDRSSVILKELFKEKNYATHRSTILKELSERQSEADAEFVREKIVEDPALFGPELEAFLLRRGDRPSAETLLSMIEGGRTSLKGKSIHLFGETALTRSLPLLIKHADEGKDGAVTMQAIARFSSPEAGSYLLQSARNAKHPVRVEAVRRLAAATEQDEARILLHSLLEDESPEMEVAALEALGGMGFNEESYSLVRDLYNKSEDTGIREAAVQTMATMRQVDPVELAAELKKEEKAEKDEKAETDQDKKSDHRNTLTDAYRDPRRLTDIVKDPKNKKTPGKETVRALFRLDESEAASRRYTTRLGSSFQRLFGNDASSVRLKIHNSLLTYSDSTSTSAAFVQRSYQKGFGVDQERSKDLLKQGLRLSHSLDAVIANVTREYSRQDLQVYALSTFFAIKRKEARSLLDAHRRRSL